MITGAGVISPLGHTLEHFWGGLTQGKSGITKITRFDISNFPVKVAAEVKDFDPTCYMPPKLADRTGRFTQFAIAAAKLAIEDAHLEPDKEKPERIGVVISSCIDTEVIGREAAKISTQGARRVDPLLISRIGPHMAAAHVGLLLGAKGPNLSVYTACASGAEAIAGAFDLIQNRYADMVLAGGTEAAIDAVPMGSLALMGALSRESDPSKASRPFDLNRSGFVYGEGAGVVVLESEEHALERKASVIAELAGIGRSFDAYNEAAPNWETQALAMRLALDSAGISPDEVDHINAHGTGTKLNDAAETKAIKEVFGKRAYSIPISANKSMLGHIISAAGALESIASILTIRDNIIPPTVNYETQDPDCDLDYVPTSSRRAQVDTCLKNSFGMGGQNCCLVFRRYEV